MKRSVLAALAIGIAAIGIAAIGIVAVIIGLAGCDNGTNPSVELEALQGTVSINGTAKVGETLTANTSGLTNASGNATYQWQANGQNIAGATSATYVLTSAENGKTITLTVSFSGNTGNITSSATAAVQPSDPTKEALRGTVSINGTAKVGETLTANTNGLTNKSGTATYQWQKDGQNIAGATGSTYTLTASENGGIITVIVSYSGNTGNITSNATATVQPGDPTKEALQGTVSINGTAKVGETLTANTNGITNASGTATYQWQANGQNIAGATGATYTLTNAENGGIITVVVSYSGNTGNITSSATAAVQPSDPIKEALQGTVAINGTAKVGETLSANTNGISNGVGTATYQWKADGQNIAGATEVTYTLTNAENGGVITVVVSYSENTGSITSAATTEVQPENTGGVYAVLADKFPVFQDAGVSDAEMVNAYAKLTTEYNDLALTYPDPLDGLLAEIHIISSTHYTWDNNTKILGIIKDTPQYYYNWLAGINNGKGAQRCLAPFSNQAPNAAHPA